MKHGRPSIPQPRRPAAPAHRQSGAAAQGLAAQLAMALAQHQQGRLDQAQLLYRKILQAQPRHFDALQLLAMTEAQKNNAAAALVLFEQALKINPRHAGALSNFGNVLRALKRPAEALASYDEALKIQPDHVEALGNRGDALWDLKRLAEALEAYGRALAIQPNNVQALTGQGRVLGELKRHAQALESLDQVLRIHPHSAEALGNRGLALYNLKRYTEALESCEHALEIKADFAQALHQRGNALRALQRPLEALESYDRALMISPGWVEALDNRGIALQDLNRFAEARDSYARALAIEPDHAETNWNDGLCRLLMGDFATGWQKYEWRWSNVLGLTAVRPFRQPLWLGRESLKDKTILLHAEQGFGDTIQFCRYAKEVAALGARVVLEVPAALKSLLQDLEGVSVLLARGESLPDFDYHCPLLSLPLAFRADLSNISGAAYLHSDPGKRGQWQDRLGPASKKRIGLVWSGATRHENDSKRSLSLEQIAPLISGHAGYYGLQKELRPADRAVLSSMPGIEVLGDALKDFSDTAAAVSLMDLVITVDTSVAHLAGALGKEVWVLLPFSPDWRWLLDRNDSPWYASARLFRQPALGDWASVLEQVRAALKTRFAFPEDVADRKALPLHKPSGAAAKDQAATDHAAKLKAALTLHQQGKLDQAAMLYQEIVRSQPQHFEALQLLATIALQQQSPEAALALFDQALAINPRHASALNNRGTALRDLGRMQEALQSYDRAIEIQPDYAEALSNRGAALRDLNRPAEAVESCDRALAIKPDFADALTNRIAAQQDLSRREKVQPSQEKPDAAARSLAAKLSAALAIHQQGRLDQAAAQYREILQSQPQHCEALQLLATVALQQNNPAIAVALFDQALAINPRLPSALHNRGNALRDLKRPEEALASYDSALRIKPDYVEALSGRGNALNDLTRYEEALASFDRALELNPDHAEAINNRGNTLQDLRRLREALKSFEHALRIKPDYAEAHWNEGLCRLLLGDFATGWQKYEWRWKREPGSSSLRNFAQPLWFGGQKLAGKTILLHAEQGLGDTIQFCRYARRVAALGARVVLEVQPPLKALLQDLEGASLVVAQGERLPDFDFHCPLMSLPLAFKTNMGSITGTSYLRSNPEKLAEWAARLGHAGQKKVGLVWSGSRGHPHDHSRSLTLQGAKTLVTDQASYYCLQKEWRAAEPPELVSASGIEVLGDALKDFSDTAAAVSLMDLVITVDTSVAHLAGALGMEVWVLLPFSPDWRWLLDRNDSPWYASARLFRQPALGDWASVLEQVRAALAARFQ